MNVTADLQVRGLTLNLNGRTVLDRVEHCFAAGTITLLLGSNGSGKTMLLETLSGLRRPSSGEVRYGDLLLWQDKRPLKAALLAVGTAFQHPEAQLFARTVGEEFEYNLRP